MNILKTKIEVVASETRWRTRVVALRQTLLGAVQSIPSFRVNKPLHRSRKKPSFRKILHISDQSRWRLLPEQIKNNHKHIFASIPPDQFLTDDGNPSEAYYMLWSSTPRVLHFILSSLSISRCACRSPLIPTFDLPAEKKSVTYYAIDVYEILGNFTRNLNKQAQPN